MGLEKRTSCQEAVAAAAILTSGGSSITKVPIQQCKHKMWILAQGGVTHQGERYQILQTMYVIVYKLCEELVSILALLSN